MNQLFCAPKEGLLALQTCLHERSWLLRGLRVAYRHTLSMLKSIYRSGADTATPLGLEVLVVVSEGVVGVVSSVIVI